ncbi:helix-turn-helix domain-containing protein [Paraburkholderia denitrificans]|uniref:Helix-turn-helix domain-containing protein n=1 Tax=Paraburkholderia denitrificans TaxID=694025 RepID=A0ABW0J3K2_9BURK
MTPFFDFDSASPGYRNPLLMRHDDYHEMCLRLCDVRRDDLMHSDGGSADAPARTPRRAPGTAKAKTSADGGSGGDSDGDGPAHPSGAPRLYRVSDAMQQLAVSRATLYRLVAADKLRLVKIGSASRITAASINAFLVSSGA